MSRNAGFITVEGIEGVGKSTNLEFIRNFLLSRGKEVVMTREPGGTPLAEEIRALLLDHMHDNMARDTELMLMFAARAQHIAEVIKPALSKGKWVVCDRFTDATYAYQGGGRGIDQKRIAQLEDWVQGKLRPDLTILLDTTPEIGLQRAASRRQTADRFEREQQGFFTRVRQCYLDRAQAEPNRFRVVDASAPLDHVKRNIEVLLTEFVEA